MIKRFLTAFLCLCLLPVGTLAADVSDYTVESVPDKALDPDVLFLSSLDGNLSNSVGTIRFFSSYPFYSPCEGFDRCFRLTGDQKLNPYSYLSLMDVSFLSSCLDPVCLCVEFRLNLTELLETGTFIFRFYNTSIQSVHDCDVLRINKTSCSFLGTTDYISSSALSEAFFTDDFVSVKIVCIEQQVYLFVDGHLLGSGTYSGRPLSGITFCSTASYSYLDEVRFSTGKYVSDLSDYAPATEPFTVSYIPVLPELPVDDRIYFVSPLPAGELIFNSTVPADAAAGDLWLQLDTNNVCSSAQVYDGASWTDAIAGICVDGFAQDVIGYKFETGSPDVPVDPDAPRDFLSTSFTAYTVTEGFLLALLLCVVAAAILNLIKEGFYWLW